MKLNLQEAIDVCHKNLEAGKSLFTNSKEAAELTWKVLFALVWRNVGDFFA